MTQVLDRGHIVPPDAVDRENAPEVHLLSCSYKAGEDEPGAIAEHQF